MHTSLPLFHNEIIGKIKLDMLCSTEDEGEVGKITNLQKLYLKENYVYRFQTHDNLFHASHIIVQPPFLSSACWGGCCWCRLESEGL